MGKRDQFWEIGSWEDNFKFKDFVSILGKEKMKMDFDSCELCVLLLLLVGQIFARSVPLDAEDGGLAEKEIAEISQMAEHMESGEIVSRDKRGIPTIAKIMRAAYNRTDLNVMYTATRKQKIRFPMGDEIFSNSIITLALLKIYKKPPTARHWRKLVKKHNIHHGRVSMHQVISWKNDKAKVLDSRLISIEETGWITFHVTSTIREWVENPRTNKGFELRTESIRPGHAAARIARQIKFVPQRKWDRYEKRPILIIWFKPKT